MHLLLLAWLFLPVATLAVLTSGVTQLARALLVVLLFLFGGVTLSSTVPGLAAWPGDSLWNWLQYALIFGGLITIIMRQYARRRTANARWLLLGWALVTAAFTAAIPYRTLIARKYPLAAGEQLPFHMLLDTGGQPSRVAAITDAEKNLRFQLPISAGDVAGKDNVVHLEALMVTLEAPDGDQWSSGWQPRSKILWRRDEPNETIWWSGLDTEVRISRRFFDHVKNVPIKVRVAAAATLFHRKEGTLITQTQSDFAIPGVGMCVIDHGPGARLAWCRSPLRIPMMLEVSGQVFGRCPPEKDGLVAQSTEFVSNLAPWLENFGLSPVKVFTPYLTITKPENVVLSVCPGMPLTFSPSETAGQIRVEAEFNDITLANYWAGRFLRGSSGTSPGLGVFAH